MGSSLWAAIDPEASPAGSAAGFTETSLDPSRQTTPTSAPLYSPEHPEFVFLLVLGGTFAALWYVFEHGAGAGANARVGKAKASVDASLEGDKK